jgi:hypothetical protein
VPPLNAGLNPRPIRIPILRGARLRNCQTHRLACWECATSHTWGIKNRITNSADKIIHAHESSPGLRRALDRHGCQLPLEKLDLRYKEEQL